MPRKPIEYKSREVVEWLEALLNGSLALPRFQRSYVWTQRKVSDFILALMDGRPVGTMLLIDRYRSPVPEGVAPDQRRDLERFSARPLAGGSSGLDACTELILDGQQRLTSLWRALLSESIGLQDWENQKRHAFLRVSDLSARELVPEDVVWPRHTAADALLKDPCKAAADHLIPLRLFDPQDADSRRPHRDSRLFKWCRQVSGNRMDEGMDLYDRIKEQLRATLLKRKIWYAKLPPQMNRSDAIEVFVKVNESSAVIRKFDIAVAEFGRNQRGRSLRGEISNWAERSRYSAGFFDADEEKMIPQVGELILKVACLQEGMTPTDRQFTEKKVLARLTDPAKLAEIFDGIDWTFSFLAEERIWHGKHLPSAVPLRVLPALHPEFRTIADSSDLEGIASRCLRAYLWRAFVSDRYDRSANTRLKVDFDRLRDVLTSLGGDAGRARALDDCKAIFAKADTPEPDDLGDLDNPLAPPTRKNSLSRALLVVSLHKGAKDFASGQPTSEGNVQSREAHHLYPKAFLRNHIADARKINHCLNYALVSGPTNRRVSAKPPLEYLQDRYNIDGNLGERELRTRVESHLIPWPAFAVREPNDPAQAYRAFVKKRAALMTSALQSLTGGEPL